MQKEWNYYLIVWKYYQIVFNNYFLSFLGLVDLDGVWEAFLLLMGVSICKAFETIDGMPLFGASWNSFVFAERGIDL